MLHFTSGRDFDRLIAASEIELRGIDDIDVAAPRVLASLLYQQRECERRFEMSCGTCFNCFVG